MKSPILYKKTYTSELYKVSYQKQICILKILTKTGQRDEKHAAKALEFFAGEAAVILMQSTNEAHLLEYLDGDALTALVKMNKDVEASTIICELLKKLHKPSVGTDLPSLRERYDKLYRKAENEKNSIYARAAELADSLLKNPLNQVVLHGDIHHENILHHSKRGWLAIDPKGIYGESTFDLANVFFNPSDMPEFILNEERVLKISKLVSGLMKIEQKRILQFAFTYGCLSAVWGLEDQFDISKTLELVKILEKHI
ncbi:MAG: phosphotransferase [Oligoflexia bacterium]|nr:phosphotransferase [Oligoflexia bacterium]